MVFEFKKATCVAAGSFNIYIIQPAWLAKIDVLPEGKKGQLRIRPNEPGVHISSEEVPWTLTASPAHLEVETKSPDIDCGKIVAKIFKALPWTPLKAIGNNTYYRAGESELRAAYFSEGLRFQAPSGFELTQRSFHAALKRGKTTFNLYMGVHPEEIEVVANANVDLRGEEIGVAQAAAERFLDDRELAEGLLSNIFKGNPGHVK